jgi:hypothetical protein
MAGIRSGDKSDPAHPRYTGPYALNESSEDDSDQDKDLDPGDILCLLLFVFLLSDFVAKKKGTPGGAPNIHICLVLLCYKKSRRQQGHLGKERARWVAIWRCTVAIEQGLCRSVLTGRAAGRVAAWHMG